MAFWDIFRRAAVPDTDMEQRANPLNNPGVPLSEAGFLAGLPEYQDIAVTADSIQRIPSFEAGMTVIADSLSGSPINVMDITNSEEPVVAVGHPVQDLLFQNISPIMPTGRFIEHAIRTSLAWGNSVWYIQRNAAGLPAELYPLQANNLRIKASPDRMSLNYEYIQPGGGRIVYSNDEVLHIMGPSTNGFIGYNTAEHFRDSFRLMLYLERYGRLYFQNSARPSGVLTTDQKLSPTEREQNRVAWQQEQGGGRAQGTAVLSGGLVYQPTAGSPDEAQFLDSRRYSVYECARILNIPVTKLRDNERSTYNNLLEESIDFVRETITPWARRIEQALNLSLLGEWRGRCYAAQFTLDHLLARDQLERYQAYAVGLNGKQFLTRDEVRKAEGLPAMPDEAFESAPAPQPPAEESEEEDNEEEEENES